MPATDRSVAAAWGRKSGGKQWEKWCTAYDWVNRAAEHDSDLAARRREKMASEIERAQDDTLILVRQGLVRVAERLRSMNAEEILAGQIPGWLKVLVDLQFKALGYEERLALTGKDGGPIRVDSPMQRPVTVIAVSPDDADDDTEQLTS